MTLKKARADRQLHARLYRSSPPLSGSPSDKKRAMRPAAVGTPAAWVRLLPCTSLQRRNLLRHRVHLVVKGPRKANVEDTRRVATPNGM